MIYFGESNVIKRFGFEMELIFQNLLKSWNPERNVRTCGANKTKYAMSIHIIKILYAK